MLLSPILGRGNWRKLWEGDACKTSQTTMLQIRASTSCRLPSNVLSTMKHWPPTFQGISKANYTFKINLADLAIKDSNILHVTVPLLRSSYQMLIWTLLLLSLTDSTSDSLII